MVRVKVHRIVSESQLQLRVRFPDPEGGETSLIIQGNHDEILAKEPEIPWKITWRDFWIERMEDAEVVERVRLSIGPSPEEEGQDCLQMHDAKGMPVEPENWAVVGPCHQWGLIGETRYMVLWFQAHLPLTMAIQLRSLRVAARHGTVFLNVYAERRHLEVVEQLSREVAVEVHDTEYGFDPGDGNAYISGIVAVRGHLRHSFKDLQLVKQVPLEVTPHSQREVQRYVADIMHPVWKQITYCKVSNNDKHFAMEMLRFLGIESRDIPMNFMDKALWAAGQLLEGASPLSVPVAPSLPVHPYLVRPVQQRNRWDIHGMEHSMYVTNAGDEATHGQYVYYVCLLVAEGCEARPELNGRYPRVHDNVYVHEKRVAIITFDHQVDKWVLSPLRGRFRSAQEAAQRGTHQDYERQITGAHILPIGYKPMVWTRPGNPGDRDSIFVTAFHAFTQRDGAHILYGSQRGWSLTRRSQDKVAQYFVRAGWSMFPPEDGWECGRGSRPPPLVLIDRRPERHH